MFSGSGIGDYATIRVQYLYGYSWVNLLFVEIIVDVDARFHSLLL